MNMNQILQIPEKKIKKLDIKQPKNLLLMKQKRGKN
jgi:hypothetical protein